MFILGPIPYGTCLYHMMLPLLPRPITFLIHWIQCTFQNVLYPMGYFVQQVMWGDSETSLKCKIEMNSVIRYVPSLSPHFDLPLETIHYGKYTISSFGWILKFGQSRFLLNAVYYHQMLFLFESKHLPQWKMQPYSHEN